MHDCLISKLLLYVAVVTALLNVLTGQDYVYTCTRLTYSHSVDNVEQLIACTNISRHDNVLKQLTVQSETADYINDNRQQRTISVTTGNSGLHQ